MSALNPRSTEHPNTLRFSQQNAVAKTYIKVTASLAWISYSSHINIITEDTASLIICNLNYHLYKYSNDAVKGKQKPFPPSLIPGLSHQVYTSKIQSPAQPEASCSLPLHHAQWLVEVSYFQVTFLDKCYPEIKSCGNEQKMHMKIRARLMCRFADSDLFRDIL